MPRPRSEQARRAVLEAMRRAIAAEGYEALTIEGLAEAAGTSKQTIYRWWPSKAAILGEALLDEELPNALPELPETAGGTDLADELTAWLDRAAEHLAGSEGLGLTRALIAVTASDPEVGAALNERLAGPIRAGISARVEQAKRAGRVRADVDGALLADQLIAVSAYAALSGRVLGRAEVRATVRTVLRGIAAD
ncbi:MULTISPECIES: TetR/AcrR family transcriptional regulator [unclassified Leucobacter]|uniref:TetR/AcrR family transcriptional regulator n=1 Tax=unclassified Leucobacter TaxID=2621730 RepID=UPI001F536C8F|nr:MULTISPECIES: TetR/AcrR family transcriptional regulator [unclassified Leucobacter]